MTRYTPKYLTVLQDTIAQVNEKKTFTYNEIHFLHWRLTVYPSNYTQSDNLEEVLDCYLKYVEIILKYSEIVSFESCKTYKSQISKYMSVIADIGTLPGLANIFVERMTASIFEHVADPSIKTICAKELIAAYNVITKSCDMSVKEKFAISEGRIHLYKLADTLCSCGDYEYQSQLLETILRICPSYLIRKYAADFFPGAESLQQALLKIDIKEFDNTTRQFLTVVNKVFENVYSFIASDILLDDINVTPPKDTSENEQEFWIDFNKLSGTIGICCNRTNLGVDLLSQDDEDSGWELITIFVKDVGSAKIKRPKDKSKGQSSPTIFKFALINPFYVKYTSSEKATTSKHLNVATYDQKIVDEMQNLVLPAMFGDKFQGVQNRNKRFALNDSTSGSYKPLDVRVNQSVRSRSIASADTRSMRSLDDLVNVRILANESKNMVETKYISPNSSILNVSIESPNCIPETQYFSAEEDLNIPIKPCSPKKEIIYQALPINDNENTHQPQNKKEKFKVKFPFIRKQISTRKKSFDPLFSPIFESIETSRAESNSDALVPQQFEIHDGPQKKSNENITSPEIVVSTPLNDKQSRVTGGKDKKMTRSQNATLAGDHLDQISSIDDAKCDLFDTKIANRLLNNIKVYQGVKKNVPNSQEMYAKQLEDVNQIQDTNEEGTTPKRNLNRIQVPKETKENIGDLDDEYFTALWDELGDVMKKAEEENLANSQRNLNLNGELVSNSQIKERKKPRTTREIKSADKQITFKSDDNTSNSQVGSWNSQKAKLRKGKNRKRESLDIVSPTVVEVAARSQEVETNDINCISQEKTTQTINGETTDNLFNNIKTIESNNLCKSIVGQKLEEKVSPHKSSASQKSTETSTTNRNRDHKKEEEKISQCRDEIENNQEMLLKSKNSSPVIIENNICEVIEIDLSDVENDAEKEGNNLEHATNLSPNTQRSKTDPGENCLNQIDAVNPHLIVSPNQSQHDSDSTFVEESLLAKLLNTESEIITRNTENEIDNFLQSEKTSKLNIDGNAPIIDLTEVSDEEIDFLEKDKCNQSDMIASLSLLDHYDSDISSQVISGRFKSKQKRKIRSKIMRSQRTTRQDEMNDDNRENVDNIGNNKGVNLETHKDLKECENDMGNKVEENDQNMVNDRLETDVSPNGNIDEFIDKQNSLFDIFLIRGNEDSSNVNGISDVIENKVIDPKQKIADQVVPIKRRSRRRLVEDDGVLIQKTVIIESCDVERKTKRKSRAKVESSNVESSEVLQNNGEKSEVAPSIKETRSKNKKLAQEDNSSNEFKFKDNKISSVGNKITKDKRRIESQGIHSNNDALQKENNFDNGSSGDFKEVTDSIQKTVEEVIPTKKHSRRKRYTDPFKDDDVSIQEEDVIGSCDLEGKTRRKSKTNVENSDFESSELLQDSEKKSEVISNITKTRGKNKKLSHSLSETEFKDKKDYSMGDKKVIKDKKGNESQSIQPIHLLPAGIENCSINENNILEDMSIQKQPTENVDFNGKNSTIVDVSKDRLPEKSGVPESDHDDFSIKKSLSRRKINREQINTMKGNYDINGISEPDDHFHINTRSITRTKINTSEIEKVEEDDNLNAISELADDDFCRKSGSPTRKKLSRRKINRIDSDDSTPVSSKEEDTKQTEKEDGESQEQDNIEESENLELKSRKRKRIISSEEDVKETEVSNRKGEGGDQIDGEKESGSKKTTSINKTYGEPDTDLQQGRIEWDARNVVDQIKSTSQETRSLEQEKSVPKVSFLSNEDDLDKMPGDKMESDKTQEKQVAEEIEGNVVSDNNKVCESDNQARKEADIIISLQNKNEDVVKIDDSIPKTPLGIFDVNSEKIISSSQISRNNDSKRKLSQSDTKLHVKESKIKRLLFDPNDLTFLEDCVSGEDYNRTCKNKSVIPLIGSTKKKSTNDTTYAKTKKVLKQNETIEKRTQTKEAASKFVHRGSDTVNEHKSQIHNASKLQHSRSRKPFNNFDKGLTLNKRKMSDVSTVVLPGTDDDTPDEITNDGHEDPLPENQNQPPVILKKIINSFPNKNENHSTTRKKRQRILSTSSSEDEPPKHFSVVALVHSPPKDIDKHQKTIETKKIKKRKSDVDIVKEVSRIVKPAKNITKSKRARKSAANSKWSPKTTKLDDEQKEQFYTFLGSFVEDLHRSKVQQTGTKRRRSDRHPKRDKQLKKSIRSKLISSDDDLDFLVQPQCEKRQKVTILEDVVLRTARKEMESQSDAMNLGHILKSNLDIYSEGADAECPERVWREILKILESIRGVKRNIENFLTSYAPCNLKNSEEYKKLLKRHSGGENG